MRNDEALLLDMLIALRKIQRFSANLDEHEFRSHMTLCESLLTKQVRLYMDENYSGTILVRFKEV